MTQPFGSCDILSSASLALAALTANVATAPRQVASSNLRITKPPTLFQVLFILRTGPRCVQRHARYGQHFRKLLHFHCWCPLSSKGFGCSASRGQLKPETIKCYARHPERATEIKFAPLRVR